MSLYDPQMHGADCPACPLFGADRAVVPPEIRPSARMLLIARDPGEQEERAGRPFAGGFGRQVERALSEAGHARQDVSITNARLCRLRKTDPKDWDKRSLECCRPRLLKEVAQHESLVLFGATALSEVYGRAEVEAAADEPIEHDLEDGEEQEKAGRGEAGLFRLRGFPLVARVEGAEHRAIATFLAPRQKRWIPVLEADVAKAFRWGSGRLEWVEPEIIWDPSLSELDNALERFAASGELVIEDCETGDPRPRSAPDWGEWAKEPLRAELRCVGLGTENFAIVIPFKSCEVPARRFKLSYEQARTRLRNFNQSHPRIGGHNINKFDRPVLERHGMPLPPARRVFDTLTAHHVTDSEYLHDLDFLNSWLTDAPKHKPGHKHKWKHDRDLHVYCGLDCVTNRRLVPRLVGELSRELPHYDPQTRTFGWKSLVDVYKSDTRATEFCIGAHQWGVYIDVSERERHRTRLKRAMAEARDRIRQLVGRDLNPNSHDQVRRYLYEEVGLAWPSKLTEAEEPSTDKDSMYELLGRALPANVQAFIEGVMDFRRPAKMLSAFVDTALPWPEDHRLHAFWSEHVQAGGRFSANKPALQTIPDRKHDVDSLRSMIAAAPGNVLVYADKEQVELRLVTIVAQDEIWLDAFKRKLDVHKVNGGSFFKKKPGDVQEFERDYAKTLTYQFLYRGGAETALRNMHKIRDPKTGKRPYARMTLSEAERMRDLLLRDHPSIVRWWDWTDREFEKRKMLRTWLLGRVRWFRDLTGSTGGEDEEESGNEKYNHQIQGLGGDLMGGAGATGRVMDVVPHGVYGPGLIFHGHDSLMLEVEARHEQYARVALEEAMYDELGGLPLPAKAKSGHRWSELG